MSAVPQSRTPDVVSVGGALRLVTPAMVATEFGNTIEATLHTLESLGVPVVTLGAHQFVDVVVLEARLAQHVVPGVTDDESARRYIEWASRYVAGARRRAILESLREAKPLWDATRRYARKHGHAALKRRGAAKAKRDGQGTPD